MYISSTYRGLKKKESSRRHIKTLLTVIHIDDNRKYMIQEKNGNELVQKDGEKKGLNRLKVEKACDRDSVDENINSSSISDESVE